MSSPIKILQKNSQINPQEEDNFAKTKKKSIWYSALFLGFGTAILFSLTIPALLFFWYFNLGNFNKNIDTACLVNSSYQIRCGKNNLTTDECEKLNCCFDPNKKFCFHSEPSSYVYYLDNGIYVPKQRTTPTGRKSLPTIKFYCESLNDNTKRCIISDPQISNEEDSVTMKNQLATATIYRENSEEILFTTTRGPLIASEEYIEWTFQLTKEKLFGLGELLLEPKQNGTLTKVIYNNEMDHSTRPFFLAYQNGSYHGAAIFHEGLLEITVLSSNLIVVRSYPGQRLEVRIYVGPTPKDVSNQMRGDFLSPKEWHLGLHICRENPVANLNELITEYNEYKEKSKYFSYTSDCIHNDLLLHTLSNNDETKVKLLLKNILNDKRFMMSFPPQVPKNSKLYEKYTDIFLKNKNNKPYVGRYRGFEVVYPDYKHPNMLEFLNEVFTLFSEEIQGMVLTHNWPQDDHFIAKNTSFPYNVSQLYQSAMSRTLPWEILKEHNDYGDLMLKAIQNIKNNILILSPTTNFQPSIIENKNISWDNLALTLKNSLFTSIFSNPLTGLPICGSTNNYDEKQQEDLCLRWYLMASTMPIFRVSSDYKLRDPLNLQSKFAQNKAKEMVKFRGKLIPFYRTILSKNEPLIRPMFYEFPDYVLTHNIFNQYMIGSELLIVQPLKPDIESLRIYLPPGKSWFEFFGGQNYTTNKSNPWIDFPIINYDWIGFISEGSIITLVERYDLNEVHLPKIKILVVPNCKDKCYADGEIALEIPNESQVRMKFTFNDGKLELNGENESKKIFCNNVEINQICLYKNNLVGCENNSELCNI